jgi:hypothetical protein
MPKRTTDKLLLAGAQPVRICRRIGDGPCQVVESPGYAPEKPASYDDHLPADLAAGAPQLLAYSIEVMGPHGRSAGASNIAFAAAGAAPPPLRDARGKVTAEGVLLEWQLSVLSGADHKISIERTLLSTPRPASPESKAKSPLGSASAPVKQQTLVVHLPPGNDPGRALDPDAAFDERYSYRLARIDTVTVGGKSLDIEGPASAEIVVDTKDVFPPAVPSGLVAVSAPDEGSIDLSWTPDHEPDLAGYAVYRSEAGEPPRRISPSGKPIDTPAFRDLTAQRGHTYAYSVTAIDRDGNESARSPEVSETMAPKP